MTLGDDAVRDELHRFTFRRLTRSDFAMLAAWLAEPHVRRWWNHEFTAQAVERDFGRSADGDEPSEDHVAMLDGRAIGLVQYARFCDYPEYLDELSPVYDVPGGAVSIDYLIGDPSLVGHGLGTAMISAFVARIWVTDPMASCIIVPVNSANEASWRALLAAGFRLVARGDVEPDNPIDDPSHEVLRLDRPTPDA
jgi:aminoglycoside 6'-N-acetyltransferase